MSDIDAVAGMYNIIVSGERESAEYRVPVEEFVTKVEWKERTHLQNQIRKDVTRQLYRSEIELSGDERRELTNRVIELARAHYQ